MRSRHQFAVSAARAAFVLAMAAGTAAGYTVHATAGAGGAISPAGTAAFTNGADATFTVTPSNGFRIADVRINGVSVGPVPRYTFAGPRTNQTIEASFHIPWAVQSVSFTAGTNAAAQHRQATSVIGEPTRRTSGGTEDVTMFQPPWGTNEVVSVGAGGELVVAFDHPVLDDPKNPHGIDLLVFGNSMFKMSTTQKAFGISTEPGRVSVSQDGAAWVHLPAAIADGVFPTLGYRNTSAAQYVADGTVPADFTLPVDPSANWTNKTYAQLVALYAGSGGGSGVDLAPSGLGWIRYVKVWQPAGQAYSTEVDAFSDVAPSLRRTLTVRSAWQRCSPPEGGTVHTSGVPVACAVTAPTLAAGVGTQIVCTGWTAAGSAPSAGTGTAVRFTIGADTALTWQWETQVWLRVSAGAGGTVSTTGGWHRAGSPAVVIALPSDGYRFAGWSGDVTGDALAPSATVTMNRSRSLAAQFEPAALLPTGLEAWLDAHGLTNGVPEESAGRDDDGDGLTALEEFLAGTDPNDRASTFRIVAVDAGAGSNRLTWLGGTDGSDRPFCVLGRDSLTGAWSVLTSDRPRSPTGTNTWWHVTSDNRPWFYRLRVSEEGASSP